MKGLPTVLFLMSLAAGVARAQAEDTILRDVTAVREAVYDTAPRSGRFELEVTVTHGTDDLGGSFAVTDGRGAVTLSDAALWPREKIVAGERLRLEGTVQPTTLGYNSADAISITRLSRGEPPVTETVSVQDFALRDFSDQVVRIEGRVFDVFPDDTDRRFSFLVLVGEDDETVYIPVLASENDLSDLIDARVAVTALAIRDRGGSTKRKLGSNFSHITPERIETLEPAPADPFAVPELVGNAREILNPDPRTSRRRRIRGEVTTVWQDGLLLHRGHGDFSKIELLPDTVRPHPGDIIEAVGVPDTDLYHLNLSRARWRPVEGTLTPAEPVRDVSITDLLTDGAGRFQIDTKHHGFRVRVRGRLAERGHNELANGTFELTSDGLRLCIDASAAGEATDELAVGALLEVTGTCVVEIEAWRPQAPFPRVKGCRVVVGSADDIRVIARPPWWTTGRLLAAIGSLLVVLIASLVWNRILNRIADRRGHQLLREQIGRAKANLKAEERTRLAVELHDSLAQSLSGAAMEIEASRELKGDAPAEMLRHLDIAEKTLKSCQSELRNCLWDLRSRALEGKSLDDAIRLTLKPHSQHTHISVRFAVPRTRLSDNTAHALLRVIRELTLNAIRHGGAKTVLIAGSLEGRELLFSVKDDGSGFDPDDHPGVLQGHFGLAGVQERIEQFDGEMEVQSSPGRGTHVRLRITLPDNDEPGLP